MNSKRLTYNSNLVFELLVLWGLPIGLLLLMSSLFYVTNRSVVHWLYYIFFSVPTLLSLCLRTREIKELLRDPMVIAFVAFCAWELISVSCSPEHTLDSILVKVPLQMFILFASCGLMLHYRKELFRLILFIGATIVLVVCLCKLGWLTRAFEPSMRMIGAPSGLDNTILDSHVFGFSCVYWLYVCVTTKRLHVLWVSIPALLITSATVLATGYRTPLVALILAVLWMSFLIRNRRSVLMVTVLVLTVATILMFYPRLAAERRVSLDFEIYRASHPIIPDNPWARHIYDPAIFVQVDNYHHEDLRETHSLASGMIYYIWIIGFIPWIFMISWGLYKSLKERSQPLFILAASLLAYGIGAGLTEGRGILSPSKEHWLLLWIPMAIISGLSIAQRRHSILCITVAKPKRQAFEELCRGANVIEEDGRGPKVLLLADGSLLKLFIARRWYTSGSFSAYSERFAINSGRLNNLGIASPLILELYHLPDGSSAVRYQPLPGLTLRQALQNLESNLRGSLIESFGSFIAQLHECGVYFRSLHLGNVLLLDDVEFGLIDVADMQVYPSALRNTLRQRNLKHMQRYPQDKIWLFEDHFEQLEKGYATVASMQATLKIREQVITLASTVD